VSQSTLELIEKLAPSSFAKAGGGGWSQGQKQYQFNCHRPSNCFGIPVDLCWPGFYCNLNSISTDHKDLQTAAKLCFEMSQDFSNSLKTYEGRDIGKGERARKSVFHRIMEEYLVTWNDNFQAISLESNAITDDTITVSPSNASLKVVRPPVVNFEYKWEMGEGGGCAYMENVAYYARLIKEIYKELTNYSYCPCFLVQVVGPFLSIAGRYRSFVFLTYSFLDKVLYGQTQSQSICFAVFHFYGSLMTQMH
jgi:hypothetical protein